MGSGDSIPVKATPWSLTLGSVSGIPIRVHATFALLLLWVGSESSSQGHAALEIAFVVSIFLCVLLHELGHALAAKRFGLRTRDITLYPFGGIASLLGSTTPWSELWIALAGPAVNVVIAAVLYLAIDQLGSHQSSLMLSFITRLLESNIFLAAFNMIPAIPMDGGRVLRALLALFRVRNATAIASRLSQGLSVALGIFALYIDNPVLVIIAVFVFMNAMQELVSDRARAGAIGKTAGQVMIERDKLQILTHGMTITQALDIALRSVQPAFPVVFGEQIVGIISRDVILQEGALADEEKYLTEFVDREYLQTSPDESIDSIVAAIEHGHHDAILVVENERLVGMLYREKLIEFLYLHGIRRARAERDLNEHE